MKDEQGFLFMCVSFSAQDAHGRPLAAELIHTDGNGFISEDLARLVPAGISQGCSPKEKAGQDVSTASSRRACLCKAASRLSHLSNVNGSKVMGRSQFRFK